MAGDHKVRPALPLPASDAVLTVLHSVPSVNPPSPGPSMLPAICAPVSGFSLQPRPYAVERPTPAPRYPRRR